MTQKEYFAKAQTDKLLSLRYRVSCYYPVNEGDKPNYTEDNMWDIDKRLLYEELSKRPHRVRAKHRRKKH